jgi:hypothetical protein
VSADCAARKPFIITTQAHLYKFRPHKNPFGIYVLWDHEESAPYHAVSGYHGASADFAYDQSAGAYSSDSILELVATDGEPFVPLSPDLLTECQGFNTPYLKCQFEDRAAIAP